MNADFWSAFGPSDLKCSIVTCKKCLRRVPVVEKVDDGGNVEDSTGGMLFDDGPVCDECLGDGPNEDRKWIDDLVTNIFGPDSAPTWAER